MKSPLTPWHFANCRILRIVLSGLLLACLPTMAATYYIDGDGGSNANPGTSPGEAWATLSMAETIDLQPGDEILLQAGDVFSGKILLRGQTGTADAPIIVASYGEGAKPVINASGFLAGVHIQNSRYVEVRDLEHWVVFFSLPRM